jgi:hypothetical protein
MFDGREALADFKSNRGVAPSYLTDRIGRRALRSLSAVMDDWVKKGRKKRRGLLSQELVFN